MFSIPGNLTLNDSEIQKMIFDIIFTITPLETLNPTMTVTDYLIIKNRVIEILRLQQIVENSIS